jgi:hypothetical protein
MQHLRPPIVARIVSPTAFGTLALCPSPAWYAWRAALATPDSPPSWLTDHLRPRVSTP